MNQLLLDLIAKTAAPPALADGAAGKAPTGDPTSELFRSVLAGRLRAPHIQKTAAVSTSLGSDAKMLTALQTKIAKLLRGGASQASIVAALAAQLASSVAQKLGIAGAGAREKLQTILSKALAPPGEGGGAVASIADRARLLAQRYLRIAAVANTVAAQGSGQQKRIAGTLLDAHKAKDDPAPTSTIVQPATGSGAHVSAALAADGAPAIPVAPSISAAGSVPPSVMPIPTLAAALPAQSLHAANSAVAADRPARVAPAPSEPPEIAAARAAATPDSAAAGDGRRVALEPGMTAVASGGDTLLGRILTRAAVAADGRAAAQGSPAAELSSAAGTSVIERFASALTARRDGTAPSRPATGAALSDPASAAAAQRPAAAAAKPAASAESAPPDKALAAFVKSFAEALHADAAAPGPGVGPHAAEVATAATPAHAPADAPAGSVTPLVTPLAPFAIDRAASSPPAAPPAAAVDHGAIADQLLRGAFLRNTGGSSEMRLTLVPDSLGDLNVKLVVEAGNVTAHVVAQTPEARDALVAAQPQLTKSLAEAGLKLQSFSVDLSGSGFAGFAQQQNDGRQTDRQGRRTADTAGDERAESQLEAIPAFGPSAATGGGAGDYNYLA